LGRPWKNTSALAPGSCGICLPKGATSLSPQVCAAPVVTIMTARDAGESPWMCYTKPLYQRAESCVLCSQVYYYKQLTKWRRWMGIEPTWNFVEPHAGFEDQERHQVALHLRSHAADHCPFSPAPRVAHPRGAASQGLLESLVGLEGLGTGLQALAESFSGFLCRGCNPKAAHLRREVAGKIFQPGTSR
jgi:hypothetical protein